MIEARKPPVGWPSGCIAHGALGRVVGAGGLVLPPDRRGAFVGQRARDVGQKKTVVDVDGDSSARRRSATVAVETTGNRKTHTIHTMLTAWCGWDEKTLYSARKGENVCPTAHERQNAYHRYHAYQLVVESRRLGGEETRSDPYHASVCGKQTFGPCLDLFWTSWRGNRGRGHSHMWP